MASYVGGDKLVLNKENVTAAANLADQTFVNSNGAVPANAAKCTGGVIEEDTANTDIATIKSGTGSILAVLATGTCTRGSFAEILQTTVTTKDASGVACAGVQDSSSTNAIVGKFHTSGVANDTVLVELMDGLNH